MSPAPTTLLRIAQSGTTLPRRAWRPPGHARRPAPGVRLAAQDKSTSRRTGYGIPVVTAARGMERSDESLVLVAPAPRDGVLPDVGLFHSNCAATEPTLTMDLPRRSIPSTQSQPHVPCRFRSSWPHIRKFQAILLERSLIALDHTVQVFT